MAKDDPPTFTQKKTNRIRMYSTVDANICQIDIKLFAFDISAKDGGTYFIL